MTEGMPVPSKRILVLFDTNCINARQRDTSMTQLEAWSQEGRITLRPAFRVLLEAGGDSNASIARASKARAMGILPEPFTFDVSAFDSECYLDAPGPSFDEIAGILFPRITVARLNENQQNDVMHVLTAIGMRAHMLVSNDQDIAAPLKARKLQEHGLLVMRSEDAVVYLQRLFTEQGG